MFLHGIEIKGVRVDPQTRCHHYQTQVDIIAIKFSCCNTYYPCHLCHEEVSGHKAVIWPRSDFDTRAILCGNCGHELTIRQYLACEFTCPACQAEFNPGCRLHYGLYFETP